MTRYAYSDPQLVCISCDFSTYSENSALIHEINTGHSVAEDPVTW